MDDAQTGQITRSAADTYEAFFVPALFAEWAPRMAHTLALSSGQSVLDVACGTGVFARGAAARVAPGGAVTGLDRNAGMLAAARRAAPSIDWREGLAESLPFPAAAFDAVGCQFGLMFFEDRIKALREMWRVLHPGGRLAVAVWDDVDRSPGYAAIIALLRRLFGRSVADALRAPFVLGDPAVVRRTFAMADIPGIRIETISGSARFPSIEAWVHTDIKGWTLADMIDDAQYRALQTAARTALAPFARADGSVLFEAPAHIVSATKA
jgi:SAM-dependent methyltransferase